MRRRSSSASVHRRSGSGSPSASSEATTRTTRDGSSPWIASISVSRSKRETSVTDSRIAASVISPGGKQQCELLDFLPGGEEVAFDALGEPFERLDRGALLLAREALGEPVGKLVARHRLRFDHDAGALQRFEPFRLELLPIELGQDHEAHRVVGKLRAPRLDRARALGAGLAGGNAQLHEAPGREERQVGRAGGELSPVDAGLGEEDLALGAAGLARASRMRSAASSARSASPPCTA